MDKPSARQWGDIFEDDYKIDEEDYQWEDAQ